MKISKEELEGLKKDLQQLEDLLVKGEKDPMWLLNNVRRIRQIASIACSRMHEHKGTQEPALDNPRKS